LFAADGAQTAASRIFSIVSLLIGSGKKIRQLRLSLIAAKMSMALSFLKDRFKVISVNDGGDGSIHLRVHFPGPRIRIDRGIIDAQGAEIQ